MGLHFEPKLNYQHAAIESVCDLFKGQEICRSVFTVTRDTSADTSALEPEIDQQVYALYGLTPEGIAIVEGTAP